MKTSNKRLAQQRHNLLLSKYGVATTIGQHLGSTTFYTLGRVGCGARVGGKGGGGKQHSQHKKKPNVIEEEREEKTSLGESLRSEMKREKLSELLNLPEESDLEAEENEKEEARDVKRKMEALESFKKVVNGLSGDAVMEAAMEVRRLSKDNSDARTMLALLGAIPPLVALLDTAAPESSCQIAALYDLLNLSISNDVNKAAIVEAGAVHKMLKLTGSPDAAGGSAGTKIREAVVANFLGLSALDLNKELIGTSGAIPFLVKTLEQVDSDGSSSSSSQDKEDALRVLYNLSISPQTSIKDLLAPAMTNVLVVGGGK